MERLPYQGFFRMHAKHEHQSLRMLVKNLPRGLQSVHPRHGAIHDNHLWAKLLRELDCFRAVARFAYHFNICLIFQNAAESSPHQGMIINQQDRNFIRHVNQASLLEPSIEPPFQLYPARAAEIQPSHRATLRVLASLPVRFPAWRFDFRNLCRGLPPRLPRPGLEIADAPRLQWLPNAGSSYSKLPAPRDIHESQRCRRQQRIRPIFHRIREFPPAFPPPANTSRAYSPVR